MTDSSSWLRLSVYNHNRDKILPTNILLSRVAMTQHYGCIFYHIIEVRGWRVRVSSNWISSLVCSWLVKGGLVPVCVCLSSTFFLQRHQSGFIRTWFLYVVLKFPLNVPAPNTIALQSKAIKNSTHDLWEIEFNIDHDDRDDLHFCVWISFWSSHAKKNRKSYPRHFLGPGKYCLDRLNNVSKGKG